MPSHLHTPSSQVTIHNGDGSALFDDLPIPPDKTATDISRACARVARLDDSSDAYKIVVYDLGMNHRAATASGGPSPTKNFAAARLRSPLVLDDEDFIGDIVQEHAREHREFKLVWKVPDPADA